MTLRMIPCAAGKCLLVGRLFAVERTGLLEVERTVDFECTVAALTLVVVVVHSTAVPQVAAVLSEEPRFARHLVQFAARTSAVAVVAGTELEPELE